MPHLKNSPPAAPPIAFPLILALFFTSRLMFLLAFPAENLIIYGDFPYYFDLADLTGQGFYPFINYWQEYPPLFPYLNILVYAVAGQTLKNHILLLALVLLLFDCGNLYLLYQLTLRLRGLMPALQVAWIYTAIFIPVFFLFRSFDVITTFFILLAIYGLIKQRNSLLAVAIGLGTMVKFLPIILVASIWRLKGLKHALIFGSIALVMSLLILAPFFLINPTMTLASLRAQPSKSSYQTVWALLDGNTTTGSFGPLADHFDPTKASQPLSNPPRLSSWLTFIPFGALGLFILTRPRVLADQKADVMVFTALTFVIFFLWSPGWSPQWQTFLLPLLLLSLPERRAILFIILLGFINFLEWPLILSRGMTGLLPMTIIARTFIFILLAFDLSRTLLRGDRLTQT